jgi:UDP-N-acetylmuramoyl-tripeptide--D-alanyl-D-alanine ligase
MDMAGRLSLNNVHLPLPGEHMILNALAAAAVADTLGLSREEIRRGLGQVEAVSGRSHIVQLKDIVLIDDCYNANPVSMKAAVDLLTEADGRKVAVLGDMFELGEKEKELHYQVGEYTRGKVDVLFAVGTLAEEIYRGAESKGPAEGEMQVIYLQKKEDLYASLLSSLQPGDTLLIKASHGMGFAEVVSWLETQFT